MGESGEERTYSGTNNKHQGGITDIKKEWAQASPIKVYHHPWRTYLFDSQVFIILLL